MRMNQTARHVRLGTPEQLSFGIHENPTGRNRAFGLDRELRDGDLLMQDLTGEYEYERTGGGGGTRRGGGPCGTWASGGDSPSCWRRSWRSACVRCSRRTAST